MNTDCDFDNVTLTSELLSRVIEQIETTVRGSAIYMRNFSDAIRQLATLDINEGVEKQTEERWESDNKVLDSFLDGFQIINR